MFLSACCFGTDDFLQRWSTPDIDDYVILMVRLNCHVKNRCGSLSAARHTPSSFGIGIDLKLNYQTFFSTYLESRSSFIFLKRNMTSIKNTRIGYDRNCDLQTEMYSICSLYFPPSSLRPATQLTTQICISFPLLHFFNYWTSISYATTLAPSNTPETYFINTVCYGVI